MSSVSRDLVLLLGAILWTGCGDGPPRTLAFPEFNPRAPFPELVDRPAKAAAQEPRKASFTDRLTGSSASDGQGEERKVRTILLGDQLAGEIPREPSWSWQNLEEGTTLVACRPGEERPEALVYAEAFPARIRTAPSEEIQRFQLTVNPEGAGERLTPSAAAGLLAGGLVRQAAAQTGASGPEAAQILQLLATRTAGAGIGFHPAADSFTGWKWVGKNDGNVMVRLARFKGSWEPSPSLPAEIGTRLEALGKVPGLRKAAERLGQRSPSDRQGGSGGVSAYLLVGNATEDSEQSGIHLALLWRHSPDPRCVEGLSAFLASLHTVGASDLRAVSGEEQAEEASYDIPAAAGLEFLSASDMVSLDSLRTAPQPANAPKKRSPK